MKKLLLFVLAIALGLMISFLSGCAGGGYTTTVVTYSRPHYWGYYGNYPYYPRPYYYGLRPRPWYPRHYMGRPHHHHHHHRR